MSKINFYNIDCMELMASKPDNYYDLAIVDPIYGDEKIQGGYTSGKGGGVTKQKKYNQSIWNVKKTDSKYFKELFRVSQNQIIWGGNYFVDNLNPSMGWIFWNKLNGDVSFSDGELAYTSFDKALKVFNYRWSGMLQQNMKNKQTRIHPTEKPIALYRWLLQNYAKPGQLILDTHGGSMSSAIACDMEGFDLDICELDKEYFDEAVKRFNTYKMQQKLF